MFHLTDALAVVRIDGDTGAPDSGTIAGIWIVLPGKTGFSLDEWIKQSKPPEGK
jgi:hypothetical protein